MEASGHHSILIIKQVYIRLRSLPAVSHAKAKLWPFFCNGSSQFSTVGSYVKEVSFATSIVQREIIRSSSNSSKKKSCDSLLLR